ncbi:hypothetical protein, partial [Kribbella pratensis]|uniref:hypothetical protein n=1 Tax=Kribbella pratensis TaxID=2512112 RepID=UPI001EE0DF75
MLEQIRSHIRTPLLDGTDVLPGTGISTLTRAGTRISTRANTRTGTSISISAIRASTGTHVNT